MELAALLSAVVVGAFIWQVVSYHKRQNEEFRARKWHYENQEANRLEEEKRRVETQRIEQMTDEELDAEFDLDNDPSGDEAEARHQEAIRDVQEVMDAVYKGR
jgi:hypothetical protein